MKHSPSPTHRSLQELDERTNKQPGNPAHICPIETPNWVEKNPVCKSLSQQQIMWFPSGGLHIYVSALDSELFELELVASTSELLSATSYPYISVEKVSFSSFFFREQHLFHNPMAGPFWNMAEKFDSVTGKINPSVEQIAIRSMTWNAAHMGWTVYGLRVFVGNWSFWLKSWCRSEVVLRSFGSREKLLNNDPWIHNNYTIWKSYLCLNSPERVGSSVFLVDVQFLGAPRINSL